MRCELGNLCWFYCLEIWLVGNWERWKIHSVQVTLRANCTRGTDHVERPYQRPVPGPREVRTPHHPGGGERTPRERERTHTQRARGDYQKGNWTKLAERTDRMEWRTSERG